MRNLIDTLNDIKDALLFEGYKDDDSCVKIVDQLIKEEDENKGITLDLIQHVVASHYKIPVEKLQLNTNKREIVFPRQICYYFAIKYKIGMLDDIGKSIANRKHSTVIYASKTIANLRLVDKKIARDLSDIQIKIEGNENRF